MKELKCKMAFCMLYNDILRAGDRTALTVRLLHICICFLAKLILAVEVSFIGHLLYAML